MKVEVVPRLSTDPLDANSTHGFALVSTLVSLILITLLWSFLQTIVTANSNTLIRLQDAQQASAKLDASYQIASPIAFEALTEPDNPNVHPLNGRAIVVEYAGNKFAVSLQDKEGLVDIGLAPLELAATVLPNQWARHPLWQHPSRGKGLSLLHGLALAGAQTKDIETLSQLTTIGSNFAKLNAPTISSSYEDRLPKRRFLVLRQPQVAIFRSNKLE
ncbi:MAG: hypothetical protein ABJT31_08425 [Hyphomicrobiales bacterium]